MRAGCLWGVVLLVGLGAATALAEGPPAQGPRVFSEMVGDSEALPVACFRPGAGWRSGEACLTWLPREGVLRTPDGGETRLLGHAPRVQCSNDARMRRGLRVEASIQAEAVLWPADPAVRFAGLHEDATPAPLPREALVALYRFAGKRLGAEPGVLGITLQSTFAVDVDGDGTKDVLVLAEAVVGDTRADLAAVVLAGPTPRIVPLGLGLGPPGGLRLRAAMDLDADGTPELWVQEQTATALSGQLVRLRGEAFEELGRHACSRRFAEKQAGPEVPYDPQENACGPTHRDRLEPNDTPARATRPPLSGTPRAAARYEGLGLHVGDADWFRLPVPALGFAAASIPAVTLNAWLVLQLYAEDGTTLLARSAPEENNVAWANAGPTPRTVLLKVSRQGRGCAGYGLALESAENPELRLQDQVRRLPLPRAKQRAASPHRDREAELLALTLSPGFLAEPSDVERLSRDLAAIRAADPALRDVRHNAFHDGQHLRVFFVNPTAARQGVYSAWDTLNTAFGVKAVKPGEAEGMELEFALVLNLPRVAALYGALPGVTHVSPSGSFFDGSTVHVCRKGEVAWYTFDVGSEDCPSGCLQRTWHVFRVARPGGEPERMGTAVPGAVPEPEWLRQMRGDCPPPDPDV